MTRKRMALYGFFFAVVIAHAYLAASLQKTRAIWLNVPPVPGDRAVVMMAMGDAQLAYRFTSVMLQNIGSSGGRVLGFGKYNYAKLKDWFYLADKLDPKSNYIPLLAAYYFSAAKEKESLSHLVDYLEYIGSKETGENWRWLAQAVFIARYKQEDLNKAFELSEKLASKWREGRPGWMKQMPVFVMNARGDKEAAYDIMMGILRDEADTMHPNEVNFMVDYICTRILSRSEANINPLCQRKE